MGWKPANTRRRARRAVGRSARGEVPLDPLARLTALGLPVVPAAAPLDGGCSCDRLGCPTPAAHPLSRAWQSEASADPAQLELWRVRHPGANYMSPTGRTHDVLDVDSAVGDM
jgi:hypothetical protein